MNLYNNGDHSYMSLTFTMKESTWKIMVKEVSHPSYSLETKALICKIMVTTVSFTRKESIYKKNGEGSFMSSSLTRNENINL